MKVCNAWKAGKDGKWYYLGPDGKMLRDTWLLLGQELYRLDPDGSMFQGTDDFADGWQRGIKPC